MSKKRIKWDFWNIVTIVIIVMFVIFLIYPLLNLFLSGFQETTRVDGVDISTWTLANYTNFFSRKYCLAKSILSSMLIKLLTLGTLIFFDAIFNSFIIK